MSDTQANQHRLVVKSGSKAGEGSPKNHSTRRLVVKTATTSGIWNPQHSACRRIIQIDVHRARHGSHP